MDDPAEGSGNDGLRASFVLVEAVQALSGARDAGAVQEVVRHAARELVGAQGATFVLRDGEFCSYVEEDAIEPLWKGQRFPLEQCVSGWAMLNRDAAVIPDIYADERVPHDAYRPTFVKSMVMVPIRRSDPIGAIGTYWSTTRQPSAAEIDLLQALADSTAIALENVAVRADLEQRVADRTAALEEANERLTWLSGIDPMTGLRNRRAFEELVDHELKVLVRTLRPGLLCFVDVDGLKPVNDLHGHHAGDALIVSVGEALAGAVREADIVARHGGDEFVLFLPDASEPAEEVVERLGAAIAAARPLGSEVVPAACIGFATFDPTNPKRLPELLAAADAAMYDEKRRRPVHR